MARPRKNQAPSVAETAITVDATTKKTTRVAKGKKEQPAETVVADTQNTPQNTPTVNSGENAPIDYDVLTDAQLLQLLAQDPNAPKDLIRLGAGVGVKNEVICNLTETTAKYLSDYAKMHDDKIAEAQRTLEQYKSDKAQQMRGMLIGVIASSNVDVDGKAYDFCNGFAGVKVTKDPIPFDIRAWYRAQAETQATTTEA